MIRIDYGYRSGVLRKCEKNPRYFADSTNKPVYLTGSHTWSNMQDYLGTDPDKKFDYIAYLNWMDHHGFNFIRGWLCEEASFDNFSCHQIHIDPLPYLRNGPGLALDGQLRFDLEAFNPSYFFRIREHVIQAGKRGMYISIMLFNRWSIDIEDRVDGARSWDGHPFNKNNNINGIDGDPKGIGGRMIHTLKLHEIVKYQERYIRKVIDTVNDLENVLFEIGNEHYEDSCEWQYHIINYIKEYEADKLLQHPVGMTSGGGNDAITNQQLYQSPADWISPRNEGCTNYMDDPPNADGSKVVILDTDHLWGLGGNVDWVWKSFTRGYNPILMDPYEPLSGLENYHVGDWIEKNDRNNPIWAPIRTNMGIARSYAERVNLRSLVPRSDLASTGYCLAEFGHEYIIYVPNQRKVVVHLGIGKGSFQIEWMDLQSGERTQSSVKPSSHSVIFFNPYVSASILYIHELSR